jgi:hypothetical protein
METSRIRDKHPGSATLLSCGNIKPYSKIVVSDIFYTIKTQVVKTNTYMFISSIGIMASHLASSVCMAAILAVDSATKLKQTTV